MVGGCATRLALHGSPCALQSYYCFCLACAWFSCWRIAEYASLNDCFRWFAYSWTDCRLDPFVLYIKSIGCLASHPYKHAHRPCKPSAKGHPSQIGGPSDSRLGICWISLDSNCLPWSEYNCSGDPNRQ